MKPWLAYPWLLIIQVVSANTVGPSSNRASVSVIFENEGTEFDIVISRKEIADAQPPGPSPSMPAVEPKAPLPEPQQKPDSQSPAPKAASNAPPAAGTQPRMQAASQVKQGAPADLSNEPPLAGFNLDGILDLMAGDDQGNVNFGAIGLEIANNLANVIDMNEVGNMATTFGIMMSGIGMANNNQRQRQDLPPDTSSRNTGLNGGIASLVGQIIANNQMSVNPAAGVHRRDQTGGQTNAGLGAGNLGNLGNLLNGLNVNEILSTVANGDGNINIHGIANAIGGMVNNPNSNNNGAEGGGLNNVIGGIMNSGAVVDIADAVDNLIKGNDTSNLVGLARAVGIKNFVNIEERHIPEGCPSCFNCLYPGSVCGHNSTCNQFTGRCDCPSGWTGEDCMRPACASPIDEGKRPAARSGHCHQDTECRPGWGGWNCNTCLTDAACDPLIPTGDGGRCYRGSELISDVSGLCIVANRKLADFLPDGVVPRMTFACHKNERTCDAQFWMNGKESFYCDLDQCNTSTWGANSTALVQCKRMKCRCVPGRLLCGNFGFDISSVLEEVEGPVNIRCHDDGFSGCHIREFSVSKIIADIFGEDSIQMSCNVGQCVHYSQLPTYQKKSHLTSKGNMMIGVSMSLLMVYVVLRAIKVLVKTQGIAKDSDQDDKREDIDEKRGAVPGAKAKKGKGVSKTCHEIDDMMMSTLRATVAFRDISYSIPVQNNDITSIKSALTWAAGGNASSDTGDGQSTINILKGVSGIVKPGEILAILGASGAGKSTLLDILSRREKFGEVVGKVQINDRDLIGDITTEEFHRMSGYVDQQDLHVSTATVHEAVMTSALLRLPRSMSRTAKEGRVREVLEELGLWTVRDSRIGKSGARGISGGEMRRVSIACELVTSPSIIFLDEPTSGLDAYNAYVVMDTLSQLARRYGRTVICTIHQPRTDIFSMFDRLIILAAGQMCYSGPATTMVQYLESIGHPVPEGYNIADFSIDLVQQATVSGEKKDKNKVAISAELKPLKTADDVASSEDGDWSKLTKDSPDLLPSPAEDSQPSTKNQASALAEKLQNTSAEPKFLSKDGRQGSQFLVYDIEVSLERLVENFTQSKQYVEMIDDLNVLTGTEWAQSEFKAASSTYGGTPYTRPVTPYQQVAVIFINLRELAYLFYRRLRGERISNTFNDKHRPTVYEQFKVLSARIFNHLYRDPTLMLANYALSVFIGLMCGVLFYQLDNSIQGMQNRLGLLMFILAFYGFGCTTSLLVFSEERLLYLRERANAYYDPLAYFMAKVTFDLIPLRVVPPLLLTLIAYPMTGLAATVHQFVKFFGTLTLFNLTVASQMFFIGLLAEELVVSNFISSIMLLFSLLFGGLILNKDSMPAIIQPLCHVSSFNLAYEAMAISELRFATVEEVRFGLEIQVPSAALLSSFGFNVLAFWPDIGILLSILAGSLGLSLLWLTYVIKERR